MIHSRCAFIVMLLLAAGQVFAQAPAAAPAPPVEGFWNSLFDNAVGISILIIFLSAVITAIIQARKRDRVLLNFNNYDVTVVLENGKRIWGVAQVFPNGIVLNYREPHHDINGEVKNSFVVHASEFPAVRAILRRDQALSGELRKRRAEEVRMFHNPTLYRRFRRWAAIQFSIIRDALVRSVSVLIGQAKRRALPNSTVGSIVTTQEAEITKVSGTIVGAWDLANDPILESFYARRCILELKEGDGWRDLEGILMEYSTSWIELLDSVWPLGMEAILSPGAREITNAEANCTIERDGDLILIRNEPPETLEFTRILVDGEPYEFESFRISGGSTHRIEIPDSFHKTIRFKIISHEPSDVILPRATTLIRHRSAEIKQTWSARLGIQKARKARTG